MHEQTLHAFFWVVIWRRNDSVFRVQLFFYHVSTIRRIFMLSGIQRIFWFNSIRHRCVAMATVNSVNVSHVPSELSNCRSRTFRLWARCRCRQRLLSNTTQTPLVVTYVLSQQPTNNIDLLNYVAISVSEQESIYCTRSPAMLHFYLTTNPWEFKMPPTVCDIEDTTSLSYAWQLKIKACMLSAKNYIFEFQKWRNKNCTN